MLVDYPDIDLPIKWKKVCVGEENLNETDVQVKHVAEGIQAWLAAHKTVMIPAEIDRRALNVVSQADAPPAPGVFMPCRLQRIHDGLTAEIRNLVKGL